MSAGANLELGDDLQVSSLSIEKGGSLIFGNGTTLTVSGTLTLDASAIKLAEGIEFASYDTQKLISQKGNLTAESVASWTGGTYVIGGKEYTTGLSIEGDAISLTFKEIVNTSADDPTKVQSYTRDGNALTLMVEDPISANANVYVGLLESSMADEILTGLKGETMVTIALKGSNGVLVNADTIDKVVFVNEKGQGYWGEMVGGKLMYNVNRIPEPASATLSLAALMMLCARRRRK